MISTEWKNCHLFLLQAIHVLEQGNKSYIASQGSPQPVGGRGIAEAPMSVINYL